MPAVGQITAAPSTMMIVAMGDPPEGLSGYVSTLLIRLRKAERTDPVLQAPIALT